VKHDVLIAAYWAAGLIAVVLGAIWVIWSAGRARVNGKRIAGHRALSDLSRDDVDPGWQAVKAMLPDCARELPETPHREGKRP
jgi:hypothetical protein